VANVPVLMDLVEVFAEALPAAAAKRLAPAGAMPQSSQQPSTIVPVHPFLLHFSTIPSNRLMVGLTM
jgi:hypothetical protein